MTKDEALRLALEEIKTKSVCQTARTIAKDALRKALEQPEPEPSDLYWRLHSLSKSLESSGRIDEQDCEGAYATLLDAMNVVMPREPLTQDEALRLALEALESCSTGDYSTGHVVHPSYDCEAVEKAITAIKQALEHPEPEILGWATHHDEPMLFPTRKEAVLYCEDDEEPRPLYTSPPKRKPLTDEEERKAFEDYALRTICNPVELQRKRLSGYGSEELNYLWRGWKARAAHGIKE